MGCRTELDDAKLDIERLDDLIYEIDGKGIDLYNEGTDLLNAVNEEISRRDLSIKHLRESKMSRDVLLQDESRPFFGRSYRATNEQLERAVEDFSPGLITAKETLARKNEQVSCLPAAL